MVKIMKIKSIRLVSQVNIALTLKTSWTSQSLLNIFLKRYIKKVQNFRDENVNFYWQQYIELKG